MKNPIIYPLFLIVYTTGFILQVFFSVPEAVAFSKPVFLLLYAFSLLELIWIYEKKGRSLVIGAAIIGLSTFLIEVLSVETGFPFGEYSYTAMLGPLVIGVPFTIALAWVGVLMNALIISSQKNKWLRAVETGFWVVLTDLILDPVAVFENYWIWSAPNGFSYYGIPFTNFLTWFILGALLSFLFPLYKRPAQMHRTVTHMYQLMLFQFGMLAVRHGEIMIGMISIVFMALAEGKYRYDRSRQENSIQKTIL